MTSASTFSTWISKVHAIAGEAPPVEMPELIWQILKGRDLATLEQIERHFSPRLKELTNPFALDAMQVAVDRLVQAFRDREKICLYADFDLDGTSGLALLKKGLVDLGFSHVIHYQPKRLSEGYGLHLEAVDFFHSVGVKLVVTIDVGITANKAIEHARSLGIDVVVTDHHLPGETLPPALAVVNPNKGSCNSDLGHLCGAGVAFYLLMALKIEFEKANISTAKLNLKSLLDCFVIGTLTDMVPLVRENRVLVKHGLVELARTQRPGLRALLRALGLWDRKLTSQDVAIRFAPKLNALSRLEMGVLPLDLFLIESDEAAQHMVGQVMANNERRIKMQAQAEEEAFAMVRARPQHNFIWVYSPNFHRGVVGLIATKLAQHYRVPAFVGSLNEDDGMIVGSARSDEGISVLEGLQSAAGVLNRFGGHDPAAGFEIAVNKADDFNTLLVGHFSGLHVSRSREIAFEAECEIAEIDEAVMTWLENLGPFGCHFEAPTLLVKDVEVVGQRQLKGGHFKFSLRDQRGRTRREALWFSPPPNHPLLGKSLDGERLDILAEPQWNHYNGSRSIQLLVRDLRLTSSD